MASHSDTTGIIDTDSRFVIDIVTGKIENHSDKESLRQYSHNSERFSFEMPRHVEGHDMTNCTKVTVNYLAADIPGEYEVDDLAVDSEDDDKITFSWLISSNVTQKKGKLRFAVVFECAKEDGTITYRWPTDINYDYEIKETISNDSGIVYENVDILEQWKQQLFYGSNSVTANIQAEGRRQQALVANKGSEVKKSIPDDYATLSDRVSELCDHMDLNIVSYTFSWIGSKKVNTTDGKLFDPGIYAASSLKPCYSNFVTIGDGIDHLEIHRSANDNKMTGGAFYSAASESYFISGFKEDSGNNISVPDGAKYFRINSTTDGSSNLALVVNGIPKETAVEVLKKSVEDIKADAEETNGEIRGLKEDIVYKRNARLIPVQFETVLGYYSSGGFNSGKKEWNARLMRVPVKKGDKYLYHGFCDNVYGVNFLNSDFSIICQINVPVNKEFEMDVDVIEDAAYIDFYSGNAFSKTYVLKYDKENINNNNDDVGRIFIDASSEIIKIYNKYFAPTREEFVDGSGMILKSITPETDTVYRFSFVAYQAASAYIDDFCIVTNSDYKGGTEVFYENVTLFVPAGKTLRINDYDSDIYTSKFEKLIPITEQYIDGKIPFVPSVVDIVKNKNMNPVTSNAVYQAIQSSMVNISTGLPFIAVASSEAPSAIKSVCQFICDGSDDNIEIQNAINSLASTGGKVFLTKGKFFISAPINMADTLIELCGEGALLDLHEDTLNSDIRGGTILQAVGNTDLVHIGGAKGTTVHDIAFFGYGRNKADNTSYGIKFTGYADTDRIYNCGFTNCAIAIGSDIATDVVYIHNLSVQRNKIGIVLYRTDAEIHDCIFCENIGMESVIWNNETYDINCSDVCTNDGKIYNNTFRRSGMCYDIYKVYGNESGLESDDVKPISSVVVRQRAYITGNKFYDCIYANCIRIMMKPDFLLIEGNSFTKWGHKDQTDDCRKSAICFDKGSVLGTIMNNRFYSDSNTDKFTDKYAIYEVSIGNDDNYWSYSNTYANNFIGNLTGETDNKCVIVGTSVNNKFINNIIAEKYKDTAIVN